MVIKVGTFAVGVILLVIGLVLHSHYGPIQAACSSPLGQVAQSLAGPAPNCGIAGTAVDASWLMIIVGGVSAVSGAISLLKVLLAPSSPKQSA